MQFDVDINNQLVTAKRGETIKNVLDRIGIHVPTLCYLPGFSPTGGCRMCVVEVDGISELVPSCSHPVTEWMKIKTHSPRVLKARKVLVELLLASHPEDSDVYREGITKITDTDVAVAKSLDLVVKLLAIAELTNEGKISVRVHPTLISRSHPLASVREAFNAVFVESESAGAMMFYGRGAGGAPTASAILGDLVAVARHRVSGGLGPRESDYADLGIAPMGSTKTRYLIRLDVADRPGVLAAVAQTFSKHDVSIQTVRQTGRGDNAELIVMTHKATDAALASTVSDLSSLDAVKDVASVIRVEGMSA